MPGSAPRSKPVSKAASAPVSKVGSAAGSKPASALGSEKLGAFISTSDPPRALTFYRDTLGLKLQEESPYALVFDCGGTMLRVQIVRQATVAPYTALGWQVQDIAQTIKKLNQAGVAMERFEGMQQDELGAWSPGGSTKVAWFKDPEGHILSLTQF
jgi:catechol 2,3-dioxygenase-like lactoylglutathione lyase family enzyme